MAPQEEILEQFKFLWQFQRRKSDLTEKRSVAASLEPRSLTPYRRLFAGLPFILPDNGSSGRSADCYGPNNVCPIKTGSQG